MTAAVTIIGINIFTHRTGNAGVDRMERPRFKGEGRQGGRVGGGGGVRGRWARGGRGRGTFCNVHITCLENDLWSCTTYSPSSTFETLVLFSFYKSNELLFTSYFLENKAALYHNTKVVVCSLT